jgi:long-chain acyl-CoA synthetase
MYPGKWAAVTPDKPALIMADTEESITYAELEDRSLRLANYMRSVGFEKGDHLAVMAENRIEIAEALWAALRTGGVITMVNTHLTAAESAYIVENCDAKVLIVSSEADNGAELARECEAVPNRVRVGREPIGADAAAFDGWLDYETVLAESSAEKPGYEPRGDDMLYSSGTTGRPKGIMPSLPDIPIESENVPLIRLFTAVFGFDQDSVYLSPAPMYHAAPLRFVMETQSQGGTVVVMPKFDPEESLRLIEKYKITHSQWVPTMFVRMLKLPEAVRSKYDLSSMEVAIHAAAPCPADVKRTMIEWWGPVIHEYYGSTESIGVTLINSQEALEHPGSVGRDGAIGTVHICGPDGEELPTGEVGLIYFERTDAPLFEYYKDPEKSRSSRHPDHPDTWATTGDMGYIDEDRFLYIVDRSGSLIITGGVNIYPQEIENALALHDSVVDVAVVGRAHDELGKIAVAFVILADEVSEESAADELAQWLGERIARYKIPREFHFVDELPRTPTGKLIKRHLPELAPVTA